MNADRPMLKAGKMMWKLIVKANCSRERSNGSFSTGAILAPPNGRRRPPRMGDSGARDGARKLLFMKNKRLARGGTPTALSTLIARLLEYRPKPREIS